MRLAPTAGFEPATKWLTATYSTAELCRSIFHTLEPAIRQGELTATYPTAELISECFICSGAYFNIYCNKNKQLVI